MRSLIPAAPLSVDAPVEMGTLVRLDGGAKLLDRDLIAGGAPWRLLRLPGGSRRTVERWVQGDEVRAGEERFARTLIQRGLLHPLFQHEVNIDDVDVVIPVRDDVASLHSLLAQLQGLHVTVVDDGSIHQGTLAECAHRFNVTLVRVDLSRGPGAARNRGVASTSRELVWFLDVDVAIDNATDVLARLAAQFDDPLLGGIAPRVRGGAGSSLRDHFENRFGPLDMGTRGGLVVPGGPVGYVPSACLLVRRSAFGDGFDETLRTGEDVDLVWRLFDQGWLVRYLSDVVVVHRARGTWRNWWDQRVGYGASTAELARRHGTRMAPLRCDVATVLAWASVLASRPMIGARIVTAARYTLRARLRDTADDADHVASEIVTKGMVRAGGPLARGIVRTYGPLVLLAALHPRLRRRALALFLVGTAWRWRATRLHASDVPLAVADDVAYSYGVFKGAWRTRTITSLTPNITKSSLDVKALLGLSGGAS